MSDINKQIDEALDEMCQYVHACTVAGGTYGVFIGGEPMQETAQAIKYLISTAAREARIDEIKRYREAMTFAHITPSIYAAERIPELLSEEQL